MAAGDTVAIVSIRRKGRRWLVQTATDGLATLPDEAMLRYGVSAGAQVPRDRWLAVTTTAAEVAGCDRLLGLLDRRAHSASELVRKLRQRHFPEPTIAAALARARTAGLVDDARFARLYAEERLRGGVARRLVVAELRRRGVSGETVSLALRDVPEAADPNADKERALDLARRKWQQLAREEDPRKRDLKLLRFLAARGFPAGLCYEVLRAVRSGGE